MPKRLPKVTLAKDARFHRTYYLSDGTEVRPLKHLPREGKVQCSRTLGDTGKRIRKYLIDENETLYLEKPGADATMSDSAVSASIAPVQPVAESVRTEAAPVRDDIVDDARTLQNVTVSATRLVGALAARRALEHALEYQRQHAYAYVLAAVHCDKRWSILYDILAQIEVDLRAIDVVDGMNKLVKKRPTNI